MNSQEIRLTIDSLFLEIGIFLSHAIWRFRTRHVRREAEAAGKTFDEYLSRKSEQASESNSQLGKRTDTPSQELGPHEQVDSGSCQKDFEDLEKGSR